MVARSISITVCKSMRPVKWIVVPKEMAESNNHMYNPDSFSTHNGNIRTDESTQPPCSNNK